ncbi:MAG: helix-turn-helix domain-containing protein [Patescibacteria group bacterium]
MAKNLKKFCKFLKQLRITQNLSLREICKKVGYDASNWSKIERGIIAPPTNEKVLAKWAKTLNLKKDSDKYQQFIDEAQISQGIIPGDILLRKDAVKYLPAVFRTLRNEKPTKEEIDRLIELIRNS